jgi:hypothetical protein
VPEEIANPTWMQTAFGMPDTSKDAQLAKQLDKELNSVTRKLCDDFNDEKSIAEPDGIHDDVKAAWLTAKQRAQESSEDEDRTERATNRLSASWTFASEHDDSTPKPMDKGKGKAKEVNEPKPGLDETGGDEGLMNDTLKEAPLKVAEEMAARLQAGEDDGSTTRRPTFLPPHRRRAQTPSSSSSTSYTRHNSLASADSSRSQSRSSAGGEQQPGPKMSKARAAILAKRKEKEPKQAPHPCFKEDNDGGPKLDPRPVVLSGIKPAAWAVAMQTPRPTPTAPTTSRPAVPRIIVNEVYPTPASGPGPTVRIKNPGTLNDQEKKYLPEEQVRRCVPPHLRPRPAKVIDTKKIKFVKRDNSFY